MSSLPQEKYRLLYVGRDWDVLRGARAALQPEGWFVVDCPDGRGACVLLDSSIRYDVLVFEHELPDMSGMELARRARAFYFRRETPLILLAREDCAIAGRRAGADRVLRKPEHIHALAETIRELRAATVNRRDEAQPDGPTAHAACAPAREERVPVSGENEE